MEWVNWLIDLHYKYLEWRYGIKRPETPVGYRNIVYTEDNTQEDKKEGS